MITSAKTARKQVPAVYQLVKKSFGWREWSENFDIGGGPWDLFTDKLKTNHDIQNLVYDPHNRSPLHNDFVFSEIDRLYRFQNGLDTVTIANVLNVIKSRKDRLSVLSLACVACPQRIYITVYEGDGDGNSRETRDGWQEHRKLSSYLDEVKEVFDDVHIVGKLLVVWRNRKNAENE